MASQPHAFFAALAGVFTLGLSASAQTVVPPPQDEARMVPRQIILAGEIEL